LFGLILSSEEEVENNYIDNLLPLKTTNTKKVGKWMSLCCTVGYKWVTVMNGVKFEFNDIISSYKKNDSERKRSVSL